MCRRGDIGKEARALRLLDALRGFKHGRALEELAAKLGVSERTVRRDLQERYTLLADGIDSILVTDFTITPPVFDPNQAIILP